MIKTWSRLLMGIVIIPLALSAQSGLFISFKTGLPISGSMVGLKLGTLSPFGGLDIVRLGGKFEDGYTSWDADYLGWDYDTGQPIYSSLYRDYRRTSEFEGSALLLMPHAGTRFYLGSFYLMGDIMMILPSVDGRNKGERIYYDQDGHAYDIERWDDKLEKDDKEDIQDALNFMVLSAGFGAEYAFSEHFAVGGEYGIRIATNKFEISEEDIDNDYPITWKEAWEEKVSMALGVTYTCFTFTFYW